MSITANRQCVRCKRRMILYSPLCPDCQELLTPNYTSLYDDPHPVSKEQFIENAFPPYEEPPEEFQQPRPNRAAEEFRRDILECPIPKEKPPDYFNPYEVSQSVNTYQYQPRPPIRKPKPRFRVKLRHLAGIIALHLLIVFVLEAWGERPIERIRQAIVQFIHLEKP